ncbi:MAG: endonuclease III [Proteobacteria bacterium]|nr:endonuclease III [Pseudomonadota bacterium]
MTRSEKAQRILAILNDLFPNPEIPLHHRSPYTLLVATVLSAQCTDVRVNKTAPKLFARASTPLEMTALEVDEIRRIIKPCGLSPSKSKAISGLSKIIVKKYGGSVPQTFEALESLPGVGHKTASVVMSQAFGEPAFPVDTHIQRLAKRWGLSNGKSVVQTERDLKKVIPQEWWNRAHLQIIYFGRTYCKARGHNLKECPICSFAASKKQISLEMNQ